MKYLLSETNDPYFNLATEEYLIKNLNENLFYIYRNNSSVIIGKNQNPLIEVNLDYLSKNNILLVRRFSGGGAVYQDLGNINYSFILKDQSLNLYNFAKYSQPIIDYLNDYYHLDAKFGGRNDIQINGKKISGAAQFVINNNLIHHGTLMIDVDLSNINNILTPNYQKIASKGVKSVSARVTNIKQFITEDDFSISDFISKLILEISNGEQYILNEKEIKEITKISEQKRKAISFILHSKIDYAFQTNEYIPGFGTIQIYFNVSKHNTINDFEIFGEYFSRHDTSDLKKYFLGKKYQDSEVWKAIIAIQDFENYFHNLPKEKLFSLIMMK